MENLGLSVPKSVASTAKPNLYYTGRKSRFLNDKPVSSLEKLGISSLNLDYRFSYIFVLESMHLT